MMVSILILNSHFSLELPENREEFFRIKRKKIHFILTFFPYLAEIGFSLFPE